MTVNRMAEELSMHLESGPGAAFEGERGVEDAIAVALNRHVNP